MIWRRLVSTFRGFTASELARGYAAIGSGSVASAISQVVTRLLIAGALGAAGLGNLAIVMSLAAVVQQFVDLRVGKFSIVYGTEALARGDPDRSGAVFKLSYLIDGTTGLLGFGVIMLGAEWLTHSVARQPQLTELLRLFAIVGLIDTLGGTSDAILKAGARYRAIAAYSISMPALELLLIGTALLLGGDLRAVIWALILKATIASLVHIALAKQTLERNGVRLRTAQLRMLKDRSREIAWMLFHTNFVGYSRLVLTKLDALILGRYVSLGSVGLYRLAVSAAALVALAAEPLRGTLLQLFTRNMDKGRDVVLAIVRRATMLGGGLVALVGVVLFVSGPSVFRLVVGAEAEGVWLVLLILVLSAVINGLQVWSGPLLFAQKRPAVVGRVALGTLLLYPPLLVAGTRMLGSVGAALAFLAISVVTSTLSALAALAGVERQHPQGM